MSEEEIIEKYHHFKIKTADGIELDLIEIKYYKELLDLYKQEKEKNKELEEHQRQYLNGELITAKQGKFFEKMIKENYIRKDKIKDMMKYREFELQQEYKEFEEDVEWRTYKKILEGK